MRMRTFTEIADSIDLARSEETAEQRELMLARSRRELDALVGDSEDDGLHYLRGYAWYLHPERMNSAEIKRTVEESLSTSIALNPADPWAHYILALHFYDSDQLEDALCHATEPFVAQLPYYDAFRLAEVELCCRIRMSSIPACIERVSKYVSFCALGVLEDQTHFRLRNVIHAISCSPMVDDIALIRTDLLTLDELSHWTAFAKLIGNRPAK